jgi:hypothetical protein
LGGTVAFAVAAELGAGGAPPSEPVAGFGAFEGGEAAAFWAGVGVGVGVAEAQVEERVGACCFCEERFDLTFGCDFESGSDGE